MQLSKKIASRFLRTIRIMDTLRGPRGCPWDKHQDFDSLLPYLFSEAQEVKQAIKKRDWDNLKEELGDVLLQIVFQSRIAQEKGYFSIVDVIEGINKKLVRRHPHVFGDVRLTTPGQVYRQWNKIKAKEKRNKQTPQRRKATTRE